MTICYKCKIDKNDNEFSPSSLKNYGKCKSCISVYNKKYREENREMVAAGLKKWKKNNPEKVVNSNKKWSLANPEKIAANSKRWAKENPEKVKKSSKKWRKNNPEKVAEKSRKWAQENPERTKLNNKRWVQENKERVRLNKLNWDKNNPEYYRNWVEANRDKISVSKKKWEQNNPDKIKKKNRLYKNKKYCNDPVFRNRTLISSQVYQSLKENGGSKQGNSFYDKIGYQPQHLWDWLVSHFEPWMTLNNQGIYNPDAWDDNNPETWKWQLDHIIPQSTFHYTSMDCQEFRDCWSLSNLRPLSAKQNVFDGARRVRHINK